MKRQHTVTLDLDALDMKLLEATGFYHYLRADQYYRLFYSMGSLTWIKARLKILEDKEYIQTVKTDVSTNTTKKKPLLPYVYTYAGRSVTYLKSRGVDPERYFRPHKSAIRSTGDLYHIMALNDFIITGEVLARTDNRVTLLDKYHDLALRLDPCLYPLTVKDAQGQEKQKMAELTPDAWLAFLLARVGMKPLKASLWCELDRGYVKEGPYKRKIRGILAFFLSDGHKTRFSCKSFTVAFATTAGQKRVEIMQKWIREVMLEHGGQYKKYSEMFLLTALPPVLEPQELFFAPVWKHPFDGSNKETNWHPLFNLEVNA